MQRRSVEDFKRGIPDSDRETGPNHGGIMVTMRVHGLKLSELGTLEIDGYH